MKSDLNALMQENEVDGLLVVGPAMHNPAMVYLTGGGHLTGAELIMKRGGQGILFHGPMERDEAAKSGLETRSYSNYPMADLLKESNGDRAQAAVLKYQRMFEDAGLTRGRVAIFGVTELGNIFPLLTGLQKRLPGLEFIGDQEGKIIKKAMATKESAEVERIRRMGQITTGVVGQVADYLSSQRVKDGVLVNADGSPVTIGEVKKRINLWLSERGAENPEGTIFAIGRDAGVPHSSGTPTDLLRLGQTIVFDIYPCEEGGGYFYDFTRTWCLGYAPDEAQKLYEQVKEVFLTLMSELKMGEDFSIYQRRTCEMYEAMGHPTILGSPETEEGYVHGVGHGVGLHIHERPFSRMNGMNDDLLEAGVVMTIEPGLYYPEKGLGVRLEDTVWVRPDGVLEVLAPYPLDFVLPVKG
jgi:Xaa-Pro aminopeptidase